jgi:2-polyprenyl-3-methyl-5-hydroxy-6-metoxy-1,4-benzoquinol methylase
MANIHYNNCPVCDSKDFSHYLNAQDWGYSKKDFEIVKCSKCSFAFTQDVPDQEDIAVYYHHSDYVSHTDTNEGLFFKVYHKVREHMLNKKRVWVEKHTKKGSVLDIGAATGYFLANLKNNGWKVLGFEPEESAREIAKTKNGIDLIDDFEPLFQEGKKFDAITMWHVLEHVHELNLYFEHFKKLLTDEGKVFIAVPNHDSLDASFYKEKWAAWDMPKHLWHFNPASLEVLAEKHGFQLEKMYALPFDAFYVSLLSAQSFLGKLVAPFIGLFSFINETFNVKKSSSVLYVLKRK